MLTVGLATHLLIARPYHSYIRIGGERVAHVVMHTSVMETRQTRLEDLLCKYFTGHSPHGITQYSTIQCSQYKLVGLSLSSDSCLRAGSRPLRPSVAPLGLSPANNCALLFCGWVSLFFSTKYCDCQVSHCQRKSICPPAQSPFSTATINTTSTPFVQSSLPASLETKSPVPPTVPEVSQSLCLHDDIVVQVDPAEAGKSAIVCH